VKKHPVCIHPNFVIFLPISSVESLALVQAKSNISNTSILAWFTKLRFGRMWLQLITPVKQKGRRRKQKDVSIPVFFAEPSVHSNSFVGTEEYIAPVCSLTIINLPTPPAANTGSIGTFFCPRKSWNFLF
jgi:hypothetical protein